MSKRVGRKSGRRDFGSIVEEGTPTNPSFTIRYEEGSRRRGKRGYKSRRAAEEALARIRASRVDGVLEPKRATEVTLTEAGDEWLKLHSKPNLRSHEQNVIRWEIHIKPFFGDIPLPAITPTRILEFRSHVQSKLKGKGSAKLSPLTVNQCLQELRAILRFAVINGHIPASPTDRIGRGRLMLPVPKTKLAPPIDRPEEVGQLLDVLRDEWPRHLAVFAVMVYCGLRKGEAAGLRWSDVSLGKRILVVRRSYAKQPKSGREREVPIPPELAAILAEHRLRDPFKGDLVVTDDAGEMLTPDTKLELILHPALKRAGLRRIRVHDLRHTYAAHWMMSGGNLFDLQKNLGHSTPVLTAETYGHLSTDHRVKEAERVSYAVPAKGKVVKIAGNGDAG